MYTWHVEVKIFKNWLIPVSVSGQCFANDMQTQKNDLVTAWSANWYTSGASCSKPD